MSIQLLLVLVGSRVCNLVLGNNTGLTWEGFGGRLGDNMKVALSKRVVHLFLRPVTNVILYRQHTVPAAL